MLFRSRITTDAGTDKKMEAAATKEAGGSYEVGCHDCTHVAKEALNAGGLKNGENSEVTVSQGKSDIEYKSTETNWTPAAKMSEIERSNPGVSIDSQLTPTPINIPKFKPVIKPTYIDNTRVAHN